MEAYEYVYIQPADETYYPDWLRFVPEKIRAWVKEQYIWKKVPCEEAETVTMGLAGRHITIPLSKAALSGYEAERIHMMLQRIIARTSVQNIVVDPVLKKYMGDIPHLEGWMTARFFLRGMIEDARRRHRIPQKELALTILDKDGSDAVLKLLEEKKDELNFLTIVTEEEAVYESVCERMLVETGLLVQLLSPDNAQGMNALPGNMIIDLRAERDKLYQKFPDGAVVLELSGNDQKVRDLLVKRKDLHVYNRVQVFHEAQEVLPGVVELLVTKGGKSAEFSPDICINCCLTPDWR